MTFTEFIGSILASPEFSGLVIATLVGLAGWLARSIKQFIGEKLSAEQLKLLMTVAENAVRVAEQTGATATGAQKKAKAIEVAQSYLDAYGIKVSAEQLAGAIEAAVYSEFTQFKAPEPPIDSVISGTAAE